MARERKPLVEIMRALPRYWMVKEKTGFPLDRLPELEEALERRFAGATRVRLDGLKLEWNDGWLHVRASNTEPILRVVAEAKSAPRARALVAEAKRAIAELRARF